MNSTTIQTIKTPNGARQLLRNSHELMLIATRGKAKRFHQASL